MSPSDRKSYRVSDTQVTVKAHGPLICFSHKFSLTDVQKYNFL